MTRKTCRRRHYPLMNPISLAITGACITPGGDLDRLRLLELSAIESFRTGSATVADWRAIADLLNVCETMARSGIGHEALEACERAQAGLEEAHDRYKSTGRMGLTGPAITALRDLYEYHDLQRTNISRSEYERMIQATANRIRSAVNYLKRMPA